MEVKTVLDKKRILEILLRELPHVRERYGVVRIALYGSFATGTPTPKSDVDLVVELARPLGLEFVALGRRVDLITSETLERSTAHPRYRPIASNIHETLTDVQLQTRSDSENQGVQYNGLQQEALGLPHWCAGREVRVAAPRPDSSGVH